MFWRTGAKILLWERVNVIFLITQGVFCKFRTLRYKVLRPPYSIPLISSAKFSGLSFSLKILPLLESFTNSAAFFA